MENFVCKGQLFFSTGPNGHRCIPNGFLVCTEGLCQGAFPVLPEAYRDLPLLDFGDRLILPGLVDLHLHGPQFAYRGLGMDLELLDWLNTHTFPEEAKFRDLAYAGPAYRQFVAALQGSFTTRAAIFATAHTEATLLLMDLLEESGLITRVGRVSMDRDCPEHLREPGPEAALEELPVSLPQPAKAVSIKARASTRLTRRFCIVTFLLRFTKNSLARIHTTFFK